MLQGMGPAKMVSATPLPILKDNYAWLLVDAASGAVGLVDPAEEGPLIAAIEVRGGRLDTIFLTHHHADHVAATEVLKGRYGAQVVGAAIDIARLPRLDLAVNEGDRVPFGASHAEVLFVPGHTRGHVAYYFPAGGVLACGDTLFSLGCGRLFEGTAEEMFASLRKLAALPDETLVCCGHEYTESNLRFALSVDPDNPALHRRAEEVRAARAAGRPTVPSRLGEEKACNPFLRARDAAHFAELRARKDRF
jgi:hydroxyacylglutathione hydrolase